MGALQVMEMPVHSAGHQGGAPRGMVAGQENHRSASTGRRDKMREDAKGSRDADESRQGGDSGGGGVGASVALVQRRDAGGVSDLGTNKVKTKEWWPPRDREEKELEIHSDSTDPMHRWQRPDAATQSPVDSKEVQNLWSRDRTCPMNPDRTHPESGPHCLNRLRLIGR